MLENLPLMLVLSNYRLWMVIFQALFYLLMINHLEKLKYGAGMIAAVGLVTPPIKMVNTLLTVGIGSWEVGYTIPWNPDGSAKPFIQGSPKRVRITDSAKSKTVDFIVKSAGNTIEGIVLDSNNNPISNLDGWVYVKEYIEQDDETPLDEYFENYVADTWVDPSGRILISYSFRYLLSRVFGYPRGVRILRSC